MLWKILIVLLMMIQIYGTVISATTCISEMLACTTQMANEMAAIRNTTLLCGILEKFINCIEYSCADSLSQCELNKARSLFADLLTDYRFGCVMYIPSSDDDDDCNLPVRASSSASTLVCASSFVCVCYVLNFTF